MYAVIAAYAITRLARCETPVSRTRAAAVFGILIAALIPVAIEALRLNRQAALHVVSTMPGGLDLPGVDLSQQGRFHEPRVRDSSLGGLGLADGVKQLECIGRLAGFRQRDCEIGCIPDQARIGRSRTRSLASFQALHQ